MFTKLYLHSAVECGLGGSAYTQKFKTRGASAPFLTLKLAPLNVWFCPKHGPCVVFRTNLKGFLTTGNIYRRQKISSKTRLEPVASELESRPCTQCGWAIPAHPARQERKQEVSTSRKLTFVAVLVFCLAVSPMMMAQSSGFTNNHFEVGAFADYFRL